MEFGRVQGDFEGINFALPTDPKETTQTLQAANNNDEFEVRVGGAKWGDKRWRGLIYTPKLKESEFLNVYSQNFNTVELGPTFYNIYKAEELRRFRDQVTGSSDFKFLPRFAQSITHVRRLVNAEEQTAKFYDSLTGLGNHLIKP